MKKFHIVSLILLSVSLIGFVLWRFVVPFPDWLVRVNGLLMLAAIFTTSFSSVRILKKPQKKNL